MTTLTITSATNRRMTYVADLIFVLVQKEMKVEHEVVVLFAADRELVAFEVEPLGATTLFVHDDAQHSALRR
mgnify:CR=1 FL=1